MISTMMKSSTISSLPGPENIYRRVLQNGIVVLARATSSSGSVVVRGSLPAGGLFDPDEKLGLADFTSAALMRGTQHCTFQEIYEELESIGASLGFSGGTHLVSFGSRALVEDLDILLQKLSESLRFPVFPEDHVERLRAQLLTSLAIRVQDTAEMASLTFDRIVYREHPYRRPEDGYPETVQSIKRADLVEFHQQHYGPKGMIIAVVGGIDPTEAVDRIAKVLGDWWQPEQQSAPALPAVLPLSEETCCHVELPGKAQTDLMIGIAGPARSSPGYMAASLGNHILGQFGMMGRLGEVVREKAGLAYSVSSSLGGGLGPGPWEVNAGINPDNLDRAIDLILDEIRRFVYEPVSTDELADSQAHYTGQLPISLESNAGIASALLSLERYQLGIDYYQRYPDMVNSITPEQILETARIYFDPDRLAIASAGPGSGASRTQRCPEKK
jgi:zinc protease